MWTKQTAVRSIKSCSRPTITANIIENPGTHKGFLSLFNISMEIASDNTDPCFKHQGNLCSSEFFLKTTLLLNKVIFFVPFIQHGPNVSFLWIFQTSIIFHFYKSSKTKIKVVWKFLNKKKFWTTRYKSKDF